MAYNFRHAFGPGQVTALAIVPGNYFVVEELRNFSVSSHFDKKAIRRLGHRLPIGWATGSGTIAGTLIFAELTRGALWRVRKFGATLRLQEGQSVEGPQMEKRNIGTLMSGIRPEQLPPFNLIFVHASESGQMAISRLYGLTITDTGTTKGQGDRYAETQLQYKAKFHEQIQLHRSLSTSQMVDLANEAGMEKQRGFFDDPRQSSELLNSLVNVTGGVAGLADYLHEETAQALQAAATGGEPSAMEIADTGEVLFDPEDNTPEPETSESLREAQKKNKHFTHKVEETFIVRDSGGNFSTETFDAHLELKGQELYLDDEIIDNTENHVPVTSAKPGTATAIQPRDYYQPFLGGTDYTYDQILPFVPDWVTLTVGPDAVHREGEYDDPEVEGQKRPPVGTYERTGPFVEEAYEVKDTDPLTLDVTTAPPGTPPESGVEIEETSGGYEFDVFGGPEISYVSSKTSLLRNSWSKTEPAIGTTNKKSDRRWEFVPDSTDNTDFQLNVRIANLRVFFQFLDRDGDEVVEKHRAVSGNQLKEASQGPVHARAHLGVDPDSGDDIIDRLDVRIEYSEHDARCGYKGSASSKITYTGQWRGLEVSLDADTDGSWSGVFAGLSVSGSGAEELVVSGSGVKLEVDASSVDLLYENSEDVTV